MKIIEKRLSPESISIEISYFQWVPFIACLLFLLLPLTLFIHRMSISTFTPMLIFVPLSSVFIYFLTSKSIIVLDKSAGSLWIHRKSLIKSTSQKYLLSDLADVQLVINNPVRPPSTKSLQFVFKNSKPWKTIGTNLSQKEIIVVEKTIQNLKNFLAQ